MMKTRLIKNTCNDWLINYISELIAKVLGGFKDKTVSVLNTNTPSKTQNKINSIENPFILKEKKKKL